jgi:hypothetical protein
MAEFNASKDAYLKGSAEHSDRVFCFVLGASTSTDSQSAFITGDVLSTDSLGAYTEGAGDVTRSSIFAFIAGDIKDSKSAYTEGYLEGQPEEGEGVAVDHIWLRNSDLSLEAKFRVVAQGYNDGMLEKAESLDRTIGGGIDHSVGAVYRSWNPTIKVRETESETDYGDISDLKTFYNYNDPGGTPSNDITFVDHHQDTYTVRIVGTYNAQTLGTAIEGAHAWTLVQLRLVEVT